MSGPNQQIRLFLGSLFAKFHKSFLSSHESFVKRSDQGMQCT